VLLQPDTNERSLRLKMECSLPYYSVQALTLIGSYVLIGAYCLMPTDPRSSGSQVHWPPRRRH
jgi:hypothetical protein